MFIRMIQFRKGWKNGYMKLKKVLAYIMVFFLILNLFSGVCEGSSVQAAGESGVLVQLQVVPCEDESGRNKLQVIYSATGYKEGQDVMVERTIYRDDQVVNSDTLSFTAPAFTEEFLEDGDYRIEYRLQGSQEAPLTASRLLDNESPVISVTENEDDSLDVMITDHYLDDTCCKITYTRTYLSGMDIETKNGSIALSLQQGEGQYAGHIDLQDLFKNQLGEGVYSDLILEAQDRAGNKAATQVSLTVVVDESDPVIGVEVVDENDNPLSAVGTEDGVEYYNAKSRKLVVRIADLQLAEPDVKLWKNGTISVSPQVNSSLADNPYRKELVFPFDTDAYYTLNITAEDNSEPVHSVGILKNYIRDAQKPIFRFSRGILSYRDGGLIPASVREDGRDICYLNRPARVSFDVEELNYNTAEISIVENDNPAASYPRRMGDNPETFTSDYSDNGFYEVYATATDKAGNHAESNPLYFVIDDKKPEISITGINQGELTGNPVTLIFDAKDNYHNFSSYRILVTRENYYGIGSTRTYTFSQDEWESLPGNEVRKELLLKEEGNYKVTFDATDKAGNNSSKELSFSIDRTAPEILNLTYSDVSGAILPRYNIIFSNHVIALEFDVVDTVTGVDERGVYVTLGTADDRDENTPIYIAHRMIGNHFVTYIPTDVNLSEFDSAVTVWANDRIPNESHITSNHIIYTTDYAKIKMTCDVDYNVWTNQDVTFHTQIQDKKAGLRQIIYRVNGKIVKQIDFNKLTYEYEGDVTASESAEVVTGYPVEVEVTNNCGTTRTVARQVYIDKIAPVVTLSGVTDGTHYPTDVSFSTAVSDVSYINTVTQYVIKKTYEGREEQIAVAPFYSTDYESHNTLTMVAEGSYEIYGVTKDSAGNTTTSNHLTFVIDKTAPRLQITGISDGAISGQAVSLSFLCEETYYDTNTVTIKVERKLDSGVDEYNITGFPNTAKESVLSHTFSEDGSYTVTMSAVDKATNEAEVQKISFTVDQTKPEVFIEGTTNYQIWNRAPMISFVVEESYFETNQVSITGSRQDIDGKLHEIEIKDFASSGKRSQLNRIFDEDGIYHLTLTSKDEAGNMSQQEVNFILDTTPPEIYQVDQYKNGYFREFCLADNIEQLFRDLTVISYRILLNGVEYNGLDKITAEGKYSLYVEVTDEAGHTSKDEAEFIIDHTAPKIIFAGIKEGQMVYEPGVITISLTNTDDEITSIRLNGKELDAKQRMIHYDEPGSYQINVHCTDPAGNEIMRSVYFVYVKPSSVRVIVIILGLFVLCAGGYILLRRRKKTGEKS